MKRRKWFRVLASVFTVCSLSMAADVSTHHQTVEAFTARNLVHGSQGYDVDELQNRLRYTGYYHGKVDGIFGWKTYWAVRRFQYRFGMKVTGVVDLKTKQKLVQASAGWHYKGAANSGGGTAPRAGGGTAAKAGRGSGASASGATGGNVPSVAGLSQSDLRLMQHVVYGEARGESFEGEVAIAAVILNRIRDPRFPHSVPAIVYQPGAFTAVSDGQVNLQPDAQAMKAVLDAIHGWDPSHGAVYYFNPNTATSGWMWSRPQIIRIGKHIFCR